MSGQALLKETTSVRRSTISPGTACYEAHIDMNSTPYVNHHSYDLFLNTASIYTYQSEKKQKKGKSFTEQALLPTLVMSEIVNSA